MNKRLIAGMTGLLLLLGSTDAWAQHVQTETGDVEGDTLREVTVTSRSAQKRMEDIAREMKSSYDVSRDVEDDMSWFYKGGKSPVGVSHLFTIYTYPRQGSYGTELRYGPVRF